MCDIRTKHCFVLVELIGVCMSRSPMRTRTMPLVGFAGYHVSALRAAEIFAIELARMAHSPDIDVSKVAKLV